MRTRFGTPRPDFADRVTWVLRFASAMVLVTGAALADQPPQIHTMEAHLDRDFGYVIGETLRQTIRVEADAGYELEGEMLPQAGGAVNDFLELRDARWNEEQYSDKAVYRITLTYQVFKGVRGAENLAIPAVPLRLRRGEAALQAEVPPLQFTLNPLIPPQTPDEAVSIRGSQPAPPISGNGHGLRLGAALAGLLASLLYGGWHLGLAPFRSRRAKPFEQALKELRRLQRDSPSPETYRAALRSFHAALNECARRTVLEGQLPLLIREHPELASVREDLEAFFLASHRQFFCSANLEPYAEYPLSRLENLCLRCRAIERRNG